MAQIRDYAKLASDIKDALGADNIVNATHCATRLRLVLTKSPDDAVTKKISSMPGVIQVVEKGGQYQVVIGTHAKDVYAELMKLGEFASGGEIKQSIVERIIGTMSAVMAPFVYLLAAAGLIQGLLIIILQFFPEFAKTGTYEVFSMTSWAPFVFLPIYIAITAAKHFRCNVYVAVWCAAALCSSSMTDIAGRAGAGEAITLFGMQISPTTYTSTVLPPLFLVWMLSYLEHFVDKKLPDVMRPIATPMICTAIMVPLTIAVVGPLSADGAKFVANAYNAAYQTVPALANAVVGGFWQCAVIFGVHWAITPVVLGNFEMYGCDTFQSAQSLAVIAQMAAAFAVALKTKSQNLRGVSASAGLTAIFGITEPTIYGVTLRLKKPFICACVAGAVGAIVISFFDTHYYAYAGLPGMLSLVNAIDPSLADGYTSASFIGMLAGIATTIVLTFVLVWTVGFEDEKAAEEVQEAHKEQLKDAAATASIEGAYTVARKEAGKLVEIASPLNGEVKKLADVPDKTFSEGLLGDGVAVIPSEGKLYAPFDGSVFTLFDSKHAIVLSNGEGVEMLVHIGLETVSLNGKGFTPHVKDGDSFHKGDLLLEFDLESMKKDFNMITPVLIANAGDLTSVKAMKDSGSVKAGEDVISVEI